MSEEITYEKDLINTEGQELAEARELGVPISSILGQISDERDRRLEKSTVVIKLPSWDGALCAEYRVLPKKQVEKFGKRSGKGDIRGDMDFLARACVGVYAYMEEKDKLVPLRVGGDTADEDAPMIAFTAELLGMLGKSSLLDNVSATETPYVVIRHVFGKRDTDVAIATHAAKVFQWMTDTSQEVDGQVEGR